MLAKFDKIFPEVSLSFLINPEQIPETATAFSSLLNTCNMTLDLGSLVHRQPSHFRVLRLRYPSRTPEVASDLGDKTKHQQVLNVGA